MKKRSYRQLSLNEREYIAQCRQADMSLREIGQSLGRSASTISRELARNGDAEREIYLPLSAHRRARQRTRVPRRPRKLTNRVLWRCVCNRLRKGWSPAQIAGYLKQRHPERSEYRVSHETIYVAIYVHSRGELKKELLAHLRQAKKTRRPRSRGTDRRGQIPNMIRIGERPAEIETRQIPGHWEGDLIKGAGNRSAVATLVERHSRYVMLVRVVDASAEAVCHGLAQRFRTIPQVLRKTLTYDRGKEMAYHEELSRKTRMQIYFADPHSPWQRGSNENTNGLLRQYLPKGMDLSTQSQVELNRIAKKLNTRPRKIHNWSTPEDVWANASCVALQS